MTRGLLIILVTIVSCKTDRQEPIFHLFKTSTEYPDYKEVDYIKDKGFTMTSVDSRTALIKTQQGVEVLFVLADNEEIETKITRDYLDNFDTLSADNKIKDFGGLRILTWTSQDDSTTLTTVTFDESKIEVALKRRGDKIYLETTFDLFHRVVKN